MVFLIFSNEENSGHNKRTSWSLRSSGIEEETILASSLFPPSIKISPIGEPYGRVD
jgi:hypothetical protein